VLDFFGAIGSFIMTPLYYAISTVLIGFHKFFSLFLDPDSGAAWALSIVGLTIVIRAALIPLFVKQIKSSRNMQLLQPKVKELQKKYGHDRERLAQETMALYKEAGTNPFASCLPIILQMPIFLALFRLLDQAAHEKPKGILTQTQAVQFGHAELFGVPIS
jgi:YidC/Oxa1 family membrane protein insertase